MRFCLRPRHAPIGAILLALPVAVSVEVPPDSAMTELRVAAGAGHYVALMRDCNGNVTGKTEDDFADAAVSIDHKFGGTPISLGVTGGFLSDGRFDEDSSRGYGYISPTFGIMKHRFGMSVGAVFTSKSLPNPDDGDFENDGESDVFPTLAMRFGALDGPYFTMSVLSAFPMYSGGGYFDFGLGGQVGDRVSLWGGVSVAGMTAAGITGQLEWKLSDTFYLNTGVAAGSRESDAQYSGTLGLSYRVVH